MLEEVQKLQKQIETLIKQISKRDKWLDRRRQEVADLHAALTAKNEKLTVYRNVIHQKNEQFDELFEAIRDYFTSQGEEYLRGSRLEPVLDKYERAKKSDSEL